MTVAEIEASHRRITILRYLADDPHGASNASMLESALMHTANIMADRPQVLADIAHLQEIGAVDTDDLGAVLAVALTDKGRMAAEGRITLPGVKRPSRRR